jgi:hypothetical protein
VGGFSAAFTAQRALRSPTDVNVKKNPSLSPWCVNTSERRSLLRGGSLKSRTVQLRVNGNFKRKLKKDFSH